MQCRLRLGAALAGFERGPERADMDAAAAAPPWWPCLGRELALPLRSLRPHHGARFLLPLSIAGSFNSFARLPLPSCPRLSASCPRL